MKIVAIAHNTFKEAIRDKVLYGFLFFAIAIILFSLVLGKISLGQQVRTTIDVGLAGISFFSVLISIFVGITLLNKEIQKRQIYPVLSKPVGRAAYVLGKFFGVVLVLLVQMGLMLAVFLPLVKFQGGSISAGLMLAVLLIFLETLVIIAMSIFFTSFTSPFLSGLFCFGLFVAGRNADLISALAKNKAVEGFGPLFDALAAVIPNFYLFYPSGKMVEGTFASVHSQFVTSGYIWSALEYALLCVVGFVTAAVLLLRKKDFV